MKTCPDVAMEEYFKGTKKKWIKCFDLHKKKIIYVIGKEKLAVSVVRFGALFFFVTCEWFDYRVVLRFFLPFQAHVSIGIGLQRRDFGLYQQPNGKLMIPYSEFVSDSVPAWFGCQHWIAERSLWSIRHCGVLFIIWIWFIYRENFSHNSGQATRFQEKHEPDKFTLNSYKVYLEILKLIRTIYQARCAQSLEKDTWRTSESELMLLEGFAQKSHLA